MAEQKVKLTDLPAATDTVDTAQLLINQNSTDQKLAVTHFLRAKNNLSELTNASQARANLDVPSVDEVNEKMTGFIDGSNTFSAGAALASRSDFIWDENSKSWYYWSGDLPKDVPAASNPESTGGVGIGAWVGIGDASLKTMLAGASGSSMIGMEAGGTLKDATVNVTAEQFDAEGDGLTDDTAAIQAAIDYVYAQGGGIVKLKAKTYRAANLLLKPRVVIEGVTLETTMIKAPDNWFGNAVIMGQGYLTYKTDSASQVVPGCFSAGVRNLTIHGNATKFSGTPAKDVGCGLLLAGENMNLESIKIIYAPSVGLVTLNWGGNRDLYQAADPDRGWGHIGTHRKIRIQFCGNDCWHCESQDYYLEDIEIAKAGYLSASTDDLRSFWAPDERVANFRAWRSVSLELFHSYGNYNGYGVVFGPDTTSFTMRVQYGQMIVESCLIGAWFKKSSYVLGSRLDAHQNSQHLPVPLHAMSTYPPAIIIESSTNSGKISDFGTIHSLQTEKTTNKDYASWAVYLGGQFNTVKVQHVRSPTVAENLPGSGVLIEGDHNHLTGSIRGCFGADSNGYTSTALSVNGGFNHTVDVSIGYSARGFWRQAGQLRGRIFNEGGLTTWVSGFDGLTDAFSRSSLELSSGVGSNRMVVKSSAGTVSASTTSDQKITISGLNLPYVPGAGEVNPYLSIDAYNGSSVYPRLASVNYVATESTTSSLVFVVRLQNSDSPMQLSLSAKIN